MSPAAAIHAVLGIGIRKEAKLVGEHETHWSIFVRGHRAPGATKIQGWLDELERNGRGVVLTWDADGCRAVLL